jgi:hypothetical protein
MYCKQCNRRNHNTEDCYHLGKSPCAGCGKFGHTQESCSGKNKKRKRRSSNDGVDEGSSKKKARKEEANGRQKMGGNAPGAARFDWLASCATSSHVTNQRDAFTTYEPVHRMGASSTQARIEGKGTVEVECRCEGRKAVMRLRDVLYIPGIPHSLVSLGRWDAAGGQWACQNGVLTLTKDGKRVAQGTKLPNNLYRMGFEKRDSVKAT